jgi:hypothetical protein
MIKHPLFTSPEKFITLFISTNDFNIWKKSSMTYHWYSSDINHIVVFCVYLFYLSQQFDDIRPIYSLVLRYFFPFDYLNLVFNEHNLIFINQWYWFTFDLWLWNVNFWIYGDEYWLTAYCCPKELETIKYLFLQSLSPYLSWRQPQSNSMNCSCWFWMSFSWLIGWCSWMESIRQSNWLIESKELNTTWLSHGSLYCRSNRTDSFQRLSMVHNH